MADDSNIENRLPPKLDLRKKVVTPLNVQPTALSPAPSTAGTAAPAVPVEQGHPQDSASTSSDTSRETMRIKLPTGPQAPAAKPALPTFRTPEDAAPPEANQLATDSNQGEPAVAPAPGATGPRPLVRAVMSPKTITLKKPVPLGIKRDTPDPALPLGSKRATSKISLPSDQKPSGTAAPAMPQPIRIMPTSPSPTMAATTGEGGSNNEGSPATVIPVTPPQPAPDPKRQTSRISLESVLGNESESGPKTIKLKRPGSSTVKVQGMESTTTTDTIRKTSSVELPADTVSDDGSPDTQKKTIKVKRPSARPSLRTGGSGGGSGSTVGSGSSPTMFTAPTKALVPADSAHWFFIITGCAATIIIGVLIYVLCAQALGPNISLTKLAYWAPDAELPWPGRITR